MNTKNIKVTISNNVVDFEEGMVLFKTTQGFYLTIDKKDLEEFYSRQTIIVEVSYFSDGNIEPKVFTITMYGGEHLKLLDDIIINMISYEVASHLSDLPSLINIHEGIEDSLEFMSEMYNTDMYEGYVIGSIHSLCNGNSNKLQLNREERMLIILKHALNLTPLTEMEVANTFINETMSLKLRNGLEITLNDVSTSLLTRDLLLTFHMVLYQLSTSEHFN